MRNSLLAAAALILAGCTTVRPLSPTVVVHQDVPVVFPTVQPMTLSNVKWQVYDVNALAALVKTMQDQHSTAVVYVLDQPNYQALALNLSQMQRYITDQRSDITYLTAAIKTNLTPPTK